MYSTVHCTSSGVKTTVSVVRGFSPCAYSDDRHCSLVVRRSSSVNLVTVSMLGFNFSQRFGNVKCFGVSDLQLRLSKPKSTRHSSIICGLSVAKKTLLSLASIDIGLVTTSQRRGSTSCISEDDTLSSLCVTAATVSNDLLCFVNSNAFGMMNRVPVDVGYNLSNIRKCITRGIAFSDLRCYVGSRTKAYDILCYLSGTAKADSISDLPCVAYIQSGLPADCLSFLVISGDRHFNDRWCTVVPPVPLISTINCCNFGTLDGPTQYSTTRSADYTSLQIYNLGNRKVTSASLIDSPQKIEAESIVFKDNLWTIKFRTDRMVLSGNFMITVCIDPPGEVKILSSSRGPIVF